MSRASEPDESDADVPADDVTNRDADDVSDDGYTIAGEIRLAAGILLAQAAGLVVIAVVLIVKTFTSHAESLTGVAVTVVILLGGAALLVWAAQGIVAGQPAFRTPVIVIELLALPVGFSLQGAHYSLYAIPLLLSALAMLYLLFTPAARAVLQRPM